MTTLTPAQIAGYAKAAGFTGQGLTWAVAVALAESGGNPAARGVNSDGSVDRGLWQINAHWHPEVTDAQAYNPATAAVAAYNISARGTNWKPWATYTNGSAGAQLARAAAAAGNPAAVQNAAMWIPLPGSPLGGVPIPDPDGPLGSAVSGVAGAANALAAIGSVVVKSAEWVANPHNWTRVAFVVAGTAGALGGLYMLSESGVGGPVGAAGNVASKATGAAKSGLKIAATAAAA